jgi:N-ethylmaleimide reductase
MDVHSIVPVHSLDPVFPYQTLIVVVIFRGLMSTLFSPLSIGALNLTHRVVMAPLTRSRADLQGDVPNNLMVEYYSQRVSRGGLIIGEATTISASARGWLGAPGLYSDKQVEGWKKITSAVHANKGYMFAQLWHTGRASHVSVTGGPEPVSSSINPNYWNDPDKLTSTPGGWVQPSPHRALEISEIAGIVDDYRRAAVRAKEAGFDGVELHAANGYLIDQFLQNGCNKRTDAYGGSIENRARLLLEVVDAMTRVWGVDRVGVRIGPDGKWNGMSDSDPKALFTYVAKQLNRFGLAYLHIIEPRVKGNVVVAEGQGPIAAEYLRTLFTGKIIAAGGFEPHTAEAVVAKGAADLVSFGRYFVSNPDLPTRIQQRLPLSHYDRNTFYTFDARGYTDYPAYAEEDLTG